jgi:hypothetical protein
MLFGFVDGRFCDRTGPGRTAPADRDYAAFPRSSVLPRNVDLSGSLFDHALNPVRSYSICLRKRLTILYPIS